MGPSPSRTPRSVPQARRGALDGGTKRRSPQGGRGENFVGLLCSASSLTHLDGFALDINRLQNGVGGAVGECVEPRGATVAGALEDARAAGDVWAAADATVEPVDPLHTGAGQGGPCARDSSV